MANFVRGLSRTVKTSGILQRYRANDVNRFRDIHASKRTLSAEASVAEPEDQVVVKLSDSCVQQLKKVTTDVGHLRVLVEGGGCSGFQYQFELEETPTKEDDRLFEKDGAKVVVDVDSLEFLRGATIDYHEELIRSAFRVLGNPQAEQGCSCGASFSLKL